MKQDPSTSLISVEQAKELILQHTPVLAPVTCPLMEVTGAVSASPVMAIRDIPSFVQSSMDGYAFSFDGWQQQPLLIRGEAAAGDKIGKLKNGEAMRIFTGAPLPLGADTVVMQEKVSVNDGMLLIKDDVISKGLHARGIGSEIKSGSLALPPGTLLTPAAIGFLAGIGIKDISVYPVPRVTLIITGNELQSPGTDLEEGKVYEANSFSIGSLLESNGFKRPDILYAADHKDQLTSVIKKALESSDIVLLTGGVSVGDHDHVLEASVACGIEQVFHKVKQRPGKPLFFGRKENQLVFGLPGNPASVLSCCYNYVLPAMANMCKRPLKNRELKVTLSHTWQKPAGLTHFLKGRYEGNSVTILDAQESYRLHSFAVANCLVQLEENNTSFNLGDEVNILVF